MPRGDGTGPMGVGSMTGRGVGYCAGFAVPGCSNASPGYRFGMGFGRGRGWGRGFGFAGRGRRNRFYAATQPGAMPFGAFAAQDGRLSPETEKQSLKTEADYLQNELAAIRKRLEEIEQEADQA